jgi:hypothetical protein
MTLHSLYKKIGLYRLDPCGDEFVISFDYFKDGEYREIIVRSCSHIQYDTVSVYYKVDDSIKELTKVVCDEASKESTVCLLAYNYYQYIRKH